MNVKQAKQLDFRELLRKMGHSPVPGGLKKDGQEIWYNSPLSKENSPSFHLTKGKQVAWVFKCFSSGKEGTILDFVIAHEGYAAHDVKSALAFLRSKFQGPLFEERGSGEAEEDGQSSLNFESAEVINAADRELEFLEDLPMKSGQILGYLENSRKIPSSLAAQYLRLVRYKNLKHNKTFYAFGMKNRAGGFEIRAASDAYTFKSALIARDITVIKGQGGNKSVLLFEGMTDFLSFLVMQGQDKPFCETIILHSISSYPKAAEYIRMQQFQAICSFFDNDEAGLRCSGKLKHDFGEIVQSCSASFMPYKDVNEALKEGCKIEFGYLKR